MCPSGDGTSALVGGWEDGGNAGAAWVFHQTGGAWVQEGGVLGAGGAVGATGFGFAVALSADGGTALVGEPFAAEDQERRGSGCILGGGGHRKAKHSQRPAS